MYTIIRLIIGFVIYGIIFIIIRKIKVSKYKKTLNLMAFVGSMLFCSLLTTIPFENALVTFSSPESAYHYLNSNKIELTVNGGVTDMVVGRTDTGHNYVIMPKVKNGSKIGREHNTKIVCRTSSEPVFIDIVQYKDTGDYYIFIRNMKIGPCEISDNQNSNFQYTKQVVQVGGEEYYYSYWGYIHDFNSDYVLTVNGTDVTFEDYIAK